MNFGFKIALALVGIAFVAVVFTSFTRPPIEEVQRGYRGVGMLEVYNPRIVAAGLERNKVPAPEPAVAPAGQPASAVYQNVKVLGDEDAVEFARTMQAMTDWVSPQQGCAYCHNQENFADDGLYTKVVARRMLQMVRHINTDWKTHVDGVGVTCYTCHRGQPVPSYIWYNQKPPRAQGMAEAGILKDHPAGSAADASLPSDPFSVFLENSNNIRVIATTALPAGDRQSIKQTEWTYALMMHFSQSLGVNCTYCHNSRSFAAWDQSTPQRATAWYGIRMVRDLNNDYLESLKAAFPQARLGVEGDVPKVNCATCHQGAFKPLYGASMLGDYPELAGVVEPAAATAPAPQ
jgi:photosynthetic reaction center cytochrome c subunit